MRSRWLSVATMLAAALGGAACGSSRSASGDGGGSGGFPGGGPRNDLTIYSSLPFQGASRRQNLDVQNGMALALKQAGGRVGKFKISFRPLDDSSAASGEADDATVRANASRAVSDPTAIAYLGEFDSSATKISLPILNRAGIAQISPSNTNVGLTTNKPGGDPGAPDVYYPAGKRTFARLVPTDDIQAAAIVRAAKQDGCRSLHVWNDQQTYGEGLAENIVLAAKRQALVIEGNDPTDAAAPSYRTLASKLRTRCFAFAGVADQNAVQIFKDVYAEIGPTARMYGSNGIRDETFVDPKSRGIPAKIGAHVKITQAGLPPEKQPPAGRRVFAEFARVYNEKNPDAYTLYGYEAMSLALDAVRRAGPNGNRRDAVAKALLSTKNRKGVLGTYSIDRRGDISIKDMGLYRIKDGLLTLDRVIKVRG